MGTAFPGAALSKEHYENTLKVLEDEGVYNGQTLPNMISLNNLTVRTFLKILNFLKKSSENVWTLKKLTFWKILNFLKIFELFENFRTFWKLCTFWKFWKFFTFWKCWSFSKFLNFLKVLNVWKLSETFRTFQKVLTLFGNQDISDELFFNFKKFTLGKF